MSRTVHELRVGSGLGIRPLDDLDPCSCMEMYLGFKHKLKIIPFRTLRKDYEKYVPLGYYNSIYFLPSNELTFLVSNL